jgi:NAD(P)H-hydrate epimerase
MKVATVEEMKELDRRAIEEFGVPDAFLMENAGEAVYYVIQRELGVAGNRFTVVCGLGNNGGDGLVVARKLHSSGAEVRVFVLGDPAKFGEASKVHLEMLRASGATVIGDPKAEQVVETAAGSDAIVDAIFGTGIARDVEGPYRAVVQGINATGLPVFAIDIPSGVDGNTGAVRGVAIDAHWTVTFGLPKRGNLLYPGAGLGGRLILTHISFPPQLHRAEEITVEVSDPPPLPPRREDGHKGSFGDALFVAGASSYYGAPAFAALSMLKAGGGYSRLAAPRSVIPALAALAGEIVFDPQEETKQGSLALKAADRIIELAGEVDLVVLGPGLSLEDETRRLVRKLASRIEKPLLIDGDGLTAVAAETDVVQYRAGATVLTPHPGELARILGKEIAEIQADPVTAAQTAAESLGAIVVLKGAHSLISTPERHVYVNTSGNSGMATAGSGDVLTGTIAAMHGLGLAIEEAVRAGVFVHGLAGDLAAGERGEDGLTARDILENLPAAVRVYREDHDAVTSDFYDTVEVI